MQHANLKPHVGGALVGNLSSHFGAHAAIRSDRFQISKCCIHRGRFHTQMLHAAAFVTIIASSYRFETHPMMMMMMMVMLIKFYNHFVRSQFGPNFVSMNDDSTCRNWSRMSDSATLPRVGMSLRVVGSTYEEIPGHSGTFMFRVTLQYRPPDSRNAQLLVMRGHCYRMIPHQPSRAPPPYLLAARRS
jgi:hypothetical protein